MQRSMLLVLGVFILLVVAAAAPTADAAPRVATIEVKGMVCSG